jgi:hypothetical protein
VTASKPASALQPPAHHGYGNSQLQRPWRRDIVLVPFVRILSSVRHGKRQEILIFITTTDSQFNLPANVTLVFDLNNSTNQNINAAEILANGNEPQKGAPVVQTFMDANLNTTLDPDAVSG